MKALYKDAGAVQYDVEPIKKFHFRKNTTFGEVKKKLKLDDLDFEKLAYCFEIEVPQGADLENEPLGKYISGALYEVTAVFPPEIEKSPLTTASTLMIMPSLQRLWEKLWNRIK